MSTVPQFGVRSAFFVVCLLLAAPAFAFELSGAWATDAADCGKIFEKKGGGLTFTESSELYGSGFIVDNNQIRGKAARCTIKTRTEDGTTLHLLASCATDIMLSSVQFSLNVINDDRVSRLFPGMPGMEVTYYRCKF